MLPLSTGWRRESKLPDADVQHALRIAPEYIDRRWRELLRAKAVVAYCT